MKRTILSFYNGGQKIQLQYFYLRNGNPEKKYLNKKKKNFRKFESFQLRKFLCKEF